VTSRKVDVVTLDGGGAQVDWRLSVTGASASSFRQRYHAESTRKERLVEDLSGELGGLSAVQVEANNLDDIEQPPTLRVRARAAEMGRREGDTVSLPAGPRAHLVRDWAPLSTRTEDVRFHARATTVSDWTLHVPPGARTISSPTAQDVVTPFGAVHVTVDSSPGTVRVVTSISLDRSRVGAGEYAAFRAFCEAADHALSQRLVVSR
jgi:hypothetical protein